MPSILRSKDSFFIFFDIENFLINLFLSLKLNIQLKFNLGYSSTKMLSPLQFIFPPTIKILLEKTNLP